MGKLVRMVLIATAVASALGCGGSSGGGGGGNDSVVVADGADATGELEPGASGESLVTMEVAGTTWYRARLEATQNATLSIYNTEAMASEDLAALSTGRTCIVDFITRPSAGTYIVKVTNFSTQPLSYTLSATTHTIGTLAVNSSSPKLGTVTGKESHYYAFGATSATTHAVELWADPDTTSTRIAANLYDSEGVISDFSLVTFVWADGTSGMRDLEESLATGETYYVKVKNLPDPFEVEDTTAVDYAVGVQGY